jgi:hypothetical protein
LLFRNLFLSFGIPSVNVKSTGNRAGEAPMRRQGCLVGLPANGGGEAQRFAAAVDATRLGGLIGQPGLANGPYDATGDQSSIA